MTLEILPRAIDDLVAQFWFYESQSAGLGSYFRQSLTEDIENLRITGGVHALRFGYHCCVADRFPVAIYYRISGGVVRVHAVLDCRRHPARARQTLRDR